MGNSAGLQPPPFRSMQSLIVLSLLPMLSLCGVISHTRFEEDIGKYLDIDEFKKDMKVLNERFSARTDVQKEEINQLMANVDPISEAMAAAEQKEEALNDEIKEDLFEGDIVLNNEQLALIMANETERAKRQAATNSSIWGTAPIPFHFSPGYPEASKQVVRAATAFWNANTCVNFQENASGNDRIMVVSKGGCWSVLGKNGGTQELSLPAGGCDSFSTATHELEHALGVYHEQSRADRDSYVRVNAANIQKTMLYNFDSYSFTSSMGLPYDFGSNMHYTPDSFAKSYEQPTLIAVGAYAEYQDSMRGHVPSFLDVLKVNKFYKCDQKCANRANPCKNGGYLDVRTCSKCICPEGLGGYDCTGNPTGCVQELTATTSYTKKTIENGTYNAPAKLTFDTCSYIIKAPAGRRVEIVIDGVWGSRSGGCKVNGIEIKNKADMARRGFRFCETPATKKTYVSENNKLVVLMWNSASTLRADFSYRYY